MAAAVVMAAVVMSGWLLLWRRCCATGLHKAN
jgi:hypothetical protein